MTIDTFLDVFIFLNGSHKKEYDDIFKLRLQLERSINGFSACNLNLISSFKSNIDSFKKVFGETTTFINLELDRSVKEDLVFLEMLKEVNERLQVKNKITKSHNVTDGHGALIINALSGVIFIDNTHFILDAMYPKEYLYFPTYQCDLVYSTRWLYCDSQNLALFSRFVSEYTFWQRQADELNHRLSISYVFKSSLWSFTSSIAGYFEKNMKKRRGRWSDFKYKACRRLKLLFKRPKYFRETYSPHLTVEGIQRQNYDLKKYEIALKAFIFKSELRSKVRFLSKNDFELTAGGFCLNPITSLILVIVDFKHTLSDSYKPHTQILSFSNAKILEMNKDGQDGFAGDSLNIKQLKDHYPQILSHPLVIFTDTLLNHLGTCIVTFVAQYLLLELKAGEGFKINSRQLIDISTFDTFEELRSSLRKLQKQPIDDELILGIDDCFIGKGW